MSCSWPFFLQGRRLKRRNTLGGLEIRIRHQKVNTFKVKCPPPPKKKKNKKKKPKNLKFQATNTCSIQKMVALWNSLVTKTSSTCSIHRSLRCSCHWKPDCQVCHLFCRCLVDTVRLPCAFAPIFRIQLHFQYCCQSIKNMHIITET